MTPTMSPLGSQAVDPRHVSRPIRDGQRRRAPVDGDLEQLDLSRLLGSAPNAGEPAPIHRMNCRSYPPLPPIGISSYPSRGRRYQLANPPTIRRLLTYIEGTHADRLERCHTRRNF